MRYMGGKFRQSKVIAEYIRENKGDCTVFVEPFCGMASVSKRIGKEFDRVILSDINRHVVNLLRSLVDGTYKGYKPTHQQQVEEDYLYYKSLKDTNSNDPMIAYFGNGMSFGGRWFAGLIRNSGHNSFVKEFPSLDQVETNNRSLLIDQRQLLEINNLELVVSSYDKLPIPTGSFVYSDSPYGSGISHFYTGGFDSNKYWEWVREISADNSIVATNTCYPPDFEILHSWGDTVAGWNSESLKGKDTRSPEVLLRYIGDDEMLRRYIAGEYTDSEQASITDRLCSHVHQG